MSIIPNINNQSIAILSDIEQWKEDIADAINTKGGNSTPDESFQQLAQDIQTLPYAGISAEGIVQTEEFSFLDFIFNKDFNKIKKIVDNTITIIDRNYCLSDSKIEEIEMTALNAIYSENSFSNSKLRRAIMPNLNNIDGVNTFKNTPLEYAYFPNLRYINRGLIFQNTKLVDIELPELLECNGSSNFANILTLKNVIMPKVNSVGQYTFGYSGLVNLVMGTLQYISEIFANGKIELRNITIGGNTDVNLPFQNWTANNVIYEGQSGIDELNSNLYNNLLTKLYDHSNDGETRILQIGWLDYVSEENIAYANAKGWTITN